MVTSYAVCLVYMSSFMYSILFSIDQMFHDKDLAGAFTLILDGIRDN